MPTAAAKTGVQDTAAGAGVAEYLGLNGGLAALLQAVSVLPIGDPWQIKGSLSFTPTLISDTFPPKYVLAWKVPSGKALLFTGGLVHALAAATEYWRVCRRYFLYGYQATAVPAAPVAPTVALQAATDGIGSSGSYSYKVAAYDTFRREGPASPASATVTLTGTSRAVSVTPPALPTGGIGYNVYRCLAGQQAAGPWYFVGSTFGATAYIDAEPDAGVDTALIPLNNWAVGSIAGEVMDGPGEIIVEVGPVALTGAPTHIVYTGAYGEQKQVVAATFPTTVGQRIRVKTYGETSNFVPVPTAVNNAWRGPHTSDVRTREEEDLGATAVSGVNAAPTAGSFIVWGQQVIGVSEREEATAAIKAKAIQPVHPSGVLIPPLGEIVAEIGALAAGVAAVRDVSLFGLLIPTNGS
jgi:hypothetical protein